MDWLTFISSIVSATAWPMALLGIAVVLRKHFRWFLGSLRSIKHGDTELIFREQLEEAKSSASEDENRSVKRIPLDKGVLDLLESHPKFAVIESFQRLEHLMRLLSTRENGPPPFPIGKWIRWASQREFLSPEQQDVLSSLVSLRNIAAHEGSGRLTTGDAYEYVELAEHIESQLQHRLSGGTGYVVKE